jgi:hypothetical protein
VLKLPLVLNVISENFLVTLPRSRQQKSGFNNWVTYPHGLRRMMHNLSMIIDSFTSNNYNDKPRDQRVATLPKTLPNVSRTAFCVCEGQHAFRLIYVAAIALRPGWWWCDLRIVATVPLIARSASFDRGIINAHSSTISTTMSQQRNFCWHASLRTTAKTGFRPTHHC